MLAHAPTMAKTKLLIIGLLLASSSIAQVPFTNVNSEPCLELYRDYDALGEYRVYMVIENMEHKDSMILIT